ncbi:putative glycolipid-binding domain-containing protein [Tianweitania sp.]|uniref:putative glycolipid-binding domain-containing protein n=1 Tax=Tianweitania sp. TaxID=2021634 RepID=UPI002899238F|nr:putative glycolipid-binding domain-containing protein [Tianweitania sp.]
MQLFAGNKTLRWQSWDGAGLEHCVIRSEGLDFLAEGVIVAPTAAKPFACRYALRFDSAWHTQSLSVAVIGEERSLLLVMDAKGRWLSNSVPVLELDYALAPDLSASALTNTLAIRRLNLAEGKSANIETAYVDLPDMAVSADPQRYTCLKKGSLYLYQSRDSDFQSEIEVDADGFVVTYPGLFRRLI